MPITCDELFKIIEKGDGSVVSFAFKIPCMPFLGIFCHFEATSFFNLCRQMK